MMSRYHVQGRHEHLIDPFICCEAKKEIVPEFQLCLQFEQHPRELHCVRTPCSELPSHASHGFRSPCFGCLSHVSHGSRDLYEADGLTIAVDIAQEIRVLVVSGFQHRLLALGLEVVVALGLDGALALALDSMMALLLAGMLALGPAGGMLALGLAGVFALGLDSTLSLIVIVRWPWALLVRTPLHFVLRMS
jgi:hypothetical protein